MKTTDEFDKILNDALSGYREAQPLSGLEDRVLGRLQQQSEQRKLWWRWSFAAGLAMALLAVAVWIQLRDGSYRPRIEQTTVQRLTPVPQTDPNLAGVDKRKPDYAETAPSEVLRRPRQPGTPLSAASIVARRPKCNRFPVPAPLTSEERALMALANTNPQALQTLPRNSEALAIAPITIQPLADTGGDQGDN